MSGSRCAILEEVSGHPEDRQPREVEFDEMFRPGEAGEVADGEVSGGREVESTGGSVVSVTWPATGTAMARAPVPGPLSRVFFS